MPHPRESELLSSLPTPAREAIQSAIEVARGKPSVPAMQQCGVAFQAVGFPRDEIARVESLTVAQRAFIEIVAFRPELKLTGGIVYKWPEWSIRRWLGHEPGGALEEVVDGRPRWLDFAAVRQQPDEIARLLLQLPLADRLAVYGELDAGAYGFGAEIEFPGLEALRDEGRAWAPRHADWLIEVAQDPRVPYQPMKHASIRLPLFLSFVRSKIEIERRWEMFLPLAVERPEIFGECLTALPEGRRARAIGTALPAAMPDQIVELVGRVVDLFPLPGLVEVTLDRLRSFGNPAKQALDAIADWGKRHPALAEALAAAKKKPLKLTIEATPRPAVDQLTELQRRQLAQLDDRTHDLLEFFTIAEPKGERRFEAIVHAETDGCVFVAGTDERAVIIAQGGADGEDGALCAALDEAFAAYRKKSKKEPTRRRRAK
jgi:hypothetical protein